MVKMDAHIFFDLMSKLSSYTFQVCPVNSNIDELQLIKGNYQGIDFPVAFKQDSGTKLLDILDTGFPGFFIISERVRTILEKNGLTGWKVFPIKLCDKKGNEITGYHGFSVTGQCGPISYKKSEIIEKRRVPHGPLCKFYKGIFIDDWDGTDFFTPDGTYQTFITQRTAEIFKKNKITNVSLKSLAESEISIHSIKNTE
jgi:hypothetical protein